MSELFNFEDKNDYTGMNEWEIMDLAMNNAYKFLMGGEDWEKMENPIVWMPVNKEKAKEKDVFEAGVDDYDSGGTIDVLISYFQEHEEYEKCADLIKLKKIRINREKEFKNLKDKI
tara:strand:- start:2187 stop:2534 length:348 start_codon:yes stop_codon:yes gene_type:complete